MSTEEEEEDEDEDEEANEERARIEGDIDKVEIEFHCSISVKRTLIDLLISNNISFWPFADISWNVQVVQLVHELKAADIEEYRKKIVERDKNKEDEDKDDKTKEDEDKGIREHRRRIVVQRDTNKGEGSKFDKREKKDDKGGDAFQIDDTSDDRNHLEHIEQCEYREKSPAMVFTFDQEDIQTSKLLSFEKVFKVIKGVFKKFFGRVKR